MSLYPWQNGDRRATGHICQHAWCVIVPSGCAVSLCCGQQPEEAGIKYANVFGKVRNVSL